MVLVGRDLEYHLVPNALPWAGTPFFVEVDLEIALKGT